MNRYPQKNQHPTFARFLPDKKCIIEIFSRVEMASLIFSKFSHAFSAKCSLQRGRKFRNCTEKPLRKVPGEYMEPRILVDSGFHFQVVHQKLHRLRELRKSSAVIYLHGIFLTRFTLLIAFFYDAFLISCCLDSFPIWPASE